MRVKRRITAMIVLICMLVSCLTGCGSMTEEKQSRIMKKELKKIEKEINHLDVEKLVKDFYAEETGNEVDMAALFLVNVVGESAEPAAELLMPLIVKDINENGQVITVDELKAEVKKWKKNILKAFDYKVLGFEAIPDAQTIHENSMVAYVDQTVNLGVLEHSFSSYIEFVKVGRGWKFHPIAEADVYAGRSQQNQEATEETEKAGNTEEAAKTESIENAESDETAESIDVSDTTDSTPVTATDKSVSLDDLNFLLAPDTTITMMGYASDPNYVSMMKGLESILNDYKKHSTTVIDANADEFLRWFPYDGNVALGVTKTDDESKPDHERFGYYCLREEGTYEDENAGPISLLLEDEKGVGAFGTDNVTVLVSDLQEQGSSLYKIGTDIRKKCIQNLGNEENYAAAVLAFDFLYNGASYVMDPEHPSESIRADFDGVKDTKPLYVLIAGQKEGVRDYLIKVSKYLDTAGIPFEQVDNLKAADDPEIQVEVAAGAYADKEEINELIHSSGKEKKAILEEYLLTHITRLEECSLDDAKKHTKAEVASGTLLYKGVTQKINSSYKGFWNWTATFEELQQGMQEMLPTTTTCTGIQVYQDVDGTWTEVPALKWPELFDIIAEDGKLQVRCLGSKAGVKLKKKNLKVVFHMKQSVDKEVAYPDWIREKDFSLSGAGSTEDPKLWNQKTLDLDLFCRSILDMKTTDTIIPCSIEKEQDVEVIFFKVDSWKKLEA